MHVYCISLQCLKMPERLEKRMFLEWRSMLLELMEMVLEMALCKEER